MFTEQALSEKLRAQANSPEDSRVPIPYPIIIRKAIFVHNFHKKILIIS